MIPSRGGNTSPLITALGLLVAVVAIVGMQYLGWESGSNQLLSTSIGALMAVIAVIVVARKYRR